MNHKDMQHIDPHPKRRKAKDNPYTLHTVGMRNGTPKHYVSFKMTNDNHVCIAVKRDVYEAMNQFELDDLRYLNEISNHYERSELTEATLYNRMAHKSMSTEEIVLKQMHSEELRKGIAQLSCAQRRRLLLYYNGQFTYKQIAKMEGCTIMAIKNSIDTAKENLKKYLNQGV